MTRLVLILCLLLTSAAAGAAGAQERNRTLVTALSSDMVSIQSNFTGTDIAIFGQASDIQRQPNAPGGYDLVIVVEGPPQDITTRRKGRFLGVWVNREAERFQDVPSFYAVASTGPIGDLADRSLLDELGIGLNHINLAVSGSSNVALADRDDFRKAFVRLRQEMGLYSEKTSSIEFLTETMFRTTIPLPANIPVGTYKVKSSLFHQGELLSQTQQSLAVAKIGFEQITFELAQDFPLFYGLLAVSLAIFTGWLAGVIFKKD
ncbi:TIGR02186 family protein [Roseibium aggregatum]|uniref:TIGR02186 family protein n=1 Tax=Roseibium aggregatum TaxID=187304 RepID=A0A939J2A7_9HYPH|nr:TIGR02186 family protein [Roseibium aggregatum]MBN9669342.1 TIGR02186 family protein [Roseibium aggregatum]